jgi:hypothetical protein
MYKIIIVNYCIKINGYCYHSVTVISFSPSQKDHIKRLRTSQFEFFIGITVSCMYKIITDTAKATLCDHFGTE